MIKCQFSHTGSVVNTVVKMSHIDNVNWMVGLKKNTSGGLMIQMQQYLVVQHLKIGRVIQEIILIRTTVESSTALNTSWNRSQVILYKQLEQNTI